MRHLYQTKQSGLLLVELLVVTAISVLIFGALFLSFQFTLELIATTRSKLSALSLANDRMEFFRSLAYDDVGVVSGFPAGTIPQTSTLTLNGLDFEERVRVDYVDDPADDIAGVDSNAIITDYKQIKLEYTWTLDGDANELSLTSYIVPRSVETNVGGGTARINVLDSDSTPLVGASVRLTSASTTFTYDVTNPTDASGSALFAVPADSGYEVLVSANIAGTQYSTSSTYRATTSNPNPIVAPFAVPEAAISTLTFQIGELSDLRVRAKSVIIEDSAAELFGDGLGIASSSGTTAVSAGMLVLGDTAGVYETTGSVFLTPIAPVTIEQWEVTKIVADTPIGANYVVQIYTGDASTVYTLIPDVDLPGNSTGFTDTLLDISELDAGLYPDITVGITLSTTDTSVTPAIDELVLYWRENSADRSAFSIDVQGDKIIGTETDSSPIYKSTTTITTDVSGVHDLQAIEFDSYTFTPVPSTDLASACPAHPFNHQAGVDGEVELVYVANNTNTLRLSVVDSLGRAVPGATARLERSGYDVSQDTNTCGQTFFTGGILDDSDYTLTVSATGFSDEVIDPFTVSGDTTNNVILNP